MKACRRCSTVADEVAQFCQNCGEPFTAPQGAIPPPPIASIPKNGDSKSAGFATASIVLGALSFLFFPIILGPLGIVFGAISWKAGNKRGLTGLIVSVIGLPVGMFLGVLTWS